jgi:hypothetical protein
MFTAQPIQELLKHSTTNMKAMVLLGINGGLGIISMAMPPQVQSIPRPMAATYDDRLETSPQTKPLARLPPACATSTMINAPEGIP